MIETIKQLVSKLELFISFSQNPASASDKERRIKQAIDICKALENVLKSELE